MPNFFLQWVNKDVDARHVKQFSQANIQSSLQYKVRPGMCISLKSAGLPRLYFPPVKTPQHVLYCRRSDWLGWRNYTVRRFIEI